MGEHLDFVRTGVLAFEQIEKTDDWTKCERMAARSAVRMMMVRLGLYSAFCEALRDAEYDVDKGVSK